MKTRRQSKRSGHIIWIVDWQKYTHTDGHTFAELITQSGKTVRIIYIERMLWLSIDINIYHWKHVNILL